MHYLGVKTKLLDWIFLNIQRHANTLGLASDSVFLDACTGTGSVACRAEREGFQVVANDLLAAPAHVVRGKLGISPTRLPEIRELLFQMNALPPVEGHFYREYSPAGGRMYLTEGNALMVDAARDFIRTVPDPNLQSYLYYCLLEALSKVLNTTGMQGAYLKSWQGNSTIPISFPECPIYGKGMAQIFNLDVVDLLGASEFRKGGGKEHILYIDPPYVSREYAPNYHVYEAAVSPVDPTVRGKTGLPETYVRSEFCGKVETVEDFLVQVLQRTWAQLVVISYSSDSTVPLHRLTAAMIQGGCTQVEVQVMPYQRYKSDSDEDRNHKQDLLQEFLVLGHRESTLEMF